MIVELISWFADRVSNNWAYALLVCFAAYAAVITIYRFFFSPLSKLPGPTLAGITRYYILYYDFYDERTRKITRLHQKYGPIVRIAPNEVSFISPGAIKDIYTGSARESGFPKTNLYSIFTHFGETNMFSSLESGEHAWKRRVIAGAYSASYVLKKEEKDGDIWKTVGDYVAYIEREGVTSGGDFDEEGKAVDIFTPNSYFATDIITAHLFSKELSTKALKNVDEFPEVKQHRRFIDQTSAVSNSRRARVYLNTDFGTALRIYEAIEGKIIGLGKMLRGMNEKCDWMGSSEIRDYGYKSLDATKQKCAKLKEVDLVSERLVQNTLSTADETTPEKHFNELGATSECMDHILAGMDTTGDTLSFLLYAISLPQNRKWQDILRDDLPALGPFDQPLSGTVLAELLANPYLNAVVKETLLLYPAIPVSLPRMTPEGGRLVDGVFLPENTIASTAVEAVNYSLVKSTYPKWDPGRWLAKQEKVSELERRLWSFGSGGRGCIGKHLALLEIKLLVAALVSRYELIQDFDDVVVVKHTQWTQRKTFRDVMYMGDVKGIVRFAPL